MRAAGAAATRSGVRAGQVEGTRLRAARLLESSHAVYGVTHLASLRGCCRSAIRMKTSTGCSSVRWMISTTPAKPPCIWSGLNWRCWPNSVLARPGKLRRHRRDLRLAYVSPKSGGAVSRSAGEPWRERLLRLPAFLREGEGGSNAVGSGPAGRLSAHRPVPAPPRAGAARAGHSDARDGFINAVTKRRARAAEA